MERNGPVFLSVDGDPSSNFMARFSTSEVPVKKISGSYFQKDPFPGWLGDRSTNEKAVCFSVGPSSWLAVDRVEARGGKYCGGLCGEWGIDRLRKRTVTGSWTNTRCKRFPKSLASRCFRQRHSGAAAPSPHALTRPSSNSRSRAFRVKDAARSNSARASSKRPSFLRKSPRTLGNKW